MAQRRPSRTASTARRARERDLPPRSPRPAPTKGAAGAVPAHGRPPHREEWLDPLNEEERAALEAGWGFVE